MPCPCPCLCLCACAWPCWPAPCFPILSLCFLPPKPQVPGSEVRNVVSPRRVRRGQGDQEGYISAGVPSGRWVLGGVRALTTQLFIFQCPPYPAQRWLASLAGFPGFPGRRGFPWCLGPGRHLLIRIQYTPHPQTQARIL